MPKHHPKTKEDLEALVQDRVPEALHLEYKRSSALLDRRATAELARHVSAFANADGGTLIYGVAEENHIPISVDSGVENSKITRERIESILLSNIAPIIDNLVITQIPISQTHSGFSLEIPKSFRAPHQHRPSHSYYKRHNFRSSPMEDYEIADVRSRAHTAKPLAVFDVEVRFQNLFVFLIHNPSDDAAHDIEFDFSEPLTWTKPPPGILLEGIDVLPPGREYRIVYGTAEELLGEGSSTTTKFEVRVSYLHPAIGTRISDTYPIDLRDYLGTWPGSDPLEELGQKLDQQLRNLSSAVHALIQAVTRLAPLAGATGLRIGAPALRETARILGKEWQPLVRFSPIGRSPEFFRELLEIDPMIASRLSQYFAQQRRPGKLDEIDGITSEILARVEYYFDLEEEGR